jgi:hypothetical protein
MFASLAMAAISRKAISPPTRWMSEQTTSARRLRMASYASWLGVGALVDAQRHGRCSRDPLEAVEIGFGHGLLDPVGSDVLERADLLQRLGRRPCAVRVAANQRVVAQRVTQRSEIGNVARGAQADLQVERAKTPVPEIARILDHRLLLFAVYPREHVDAVAQRASEQAVQGFP